MIGFELHSSKKWQAARAAFVSVFAFVAVCAMAFSDLREGKSLIDILTQQPALGLSAVLFLIFSLVLIAQLHRVLTTRLVLEFTEVAIVDRRRRQLQTIPYSVIEVFSPPPEELFPTEELAAKLRDELGLDEYVSLSCRLHVRRATDVGVAGVSAGAIGANESDVSINRRDDDGDRFVRASDSDRSRIGARHGDGEGFVFFEKVKTPSYEMQKQIIQRLRTKISRFENLIHDDGTGFGDDYTNP